MDGVAKPQVEEENTTVTIIKSSAVGFTEIPFIPKCDGERDIIDYLRRQLCTSFRIPPEFFEKDMGVVKTK